MEDVGKDEYKSTPHRKTLEKCPICGGTGFDIRLGAKNLNLLEKTTGEPNLNPPTHKGVEKMRKNFSDKRKYPYLERNTKLLEQIIQALPYSSQIIDIDLSCLGEVRFTWRTQRFRVTESLMVEEVQGCLLSGSNIAILLESLLRTKR